MLRFPILLAEASPLDSLTPEPPSRASSFTLQDGLLVIGIVLGLAVILFLWAYFTRKKSHRHLETSANVIYRDEKESAEPSSRRIKIRKRRRVHPDNLPRNPTLGETGGLPPARSEEPREPAS
jgi:hypothetical protein